MVMTTSNQQTEVRTLMQRLLREGTLIVYLLLALFLLIALFTYSPEDPGYTTTGTGNSIENAVGIYGAWIADILLHLLGYLAYSFPGLLGYKVYISFRESELNSEFSMTMFGLKSFGFLVLTVSACGLATLHFEIPESIPYLAGGFVGSLVADLSVPVLAVLGSTLLFLATFLFGLTITIAISWLAVIDKIGTITIALSNWAVSKTQKWIEQKRQESETRERLESRKRLLDIHIEKEKKRTPPTIKALRKKKIAKSPRVEREKQGTLFATTSIKELPAIGLLDAWQEASDAGFSKESLEAMSKLLELKLKDFGIEIEVTAVNPGPVITRFEVQPAPGIKVSRIRKIVLILNLYKMALE